MGNTLGAIRGRLIAIAACVACCAIASFGQGPADAAGKDGQGYRIDKPGTITFTVGVKIKGKVEKPQVMIFLPKEKPAYKEVTITHSFYDDIMEPLPLKPEGK